MRAAAAQVPIQSLPDLQVARVGSLPKQGCCGDDHSVKAIAALRGLFLEEGALGRMVLPSLHQSFQRCDSRAAHSGDRKLAGWSRLVPDQHHTGATRLIAAAVLWTREPQLIPQHVKERGISRRPDSVLLSIDYEKDFFGHADFSV